jgi:hypothetical protein
LGKADSDALGYWKPPRTTFKQERRRRHLGRDNCAQHVAAKVTP